MRLFIAIWTLGFVGLITADRAPAADPGIDWCRVPENLVRADSPLPRVAEAIEKNQPIKIVVLGTMSSTGMGRGLPPLFVLIPKDCARS